MENSGSSEKVIRRLAAILALDVVGYSRMMGADEEGTLERLKSLRSEVIDGRIAGRHGRIVKLMGDGVLVEFDSAVNAVACAIDIQTRIRDWNQRHTDGPPMQVRIGINSGDIIIEGDDIYGDGVNIAARLESVADKGGIFVSASVEDSARGKVTAAFEDVGEKALKNIQHPVRVFRVVFGGETPRAPARSQRRIWLAVSASVLLIAALAWGLVRWDAPPAEPARTSVAEVPAQRSASPVIAVLPLDNMSGDKDQEYFSDGLTEDLITDISKVSGVRVIARNSTFSYKGESPDIRDVGRVLGATHVVEGSVRKAGGSVRITVQLIDAADGAHIWAERYDRKLNDIFAVQDEVTSEIVAALARRLGAPSLGQVSTGPATGSPGAAEQAGRGTTSVAAYEAFLQGWALYNRRTPENLAAAVTHFENALELDPNYARAKAALASVYWEAWKRFWQRSLGLSENYLAWEKADAYLQEALAAPTPLAYRVSSEMLVINRRYDKATAEAEAAIALDPNDSLGYVVLAEAKTFAGDAVASIGLVKKAMRIDPRYPPAYLFSLALAEFTLERYEDAARHLQQAVAKDAGDPFWLALLIASYGQLGETGRAAEVLARLDALQGSAGMPRFTVGWPTGRWPYRNASDSDRLREGFLAGGMPEG